MQHHKMLKARNLLSNSRKILNVRFLLLSCLCSGATLGCASSKKSPPEPVVESAKAAPAQLTYLSDIQQFTFAGQRAGEGYFSRDGQSLIFQSEREPNNPFYQMYIKSFQNGKTQRISPGYGSTTCGWIHPDGKQFLFSSTHLDPEWKEKAEAEWQERKNPKKKYSWSFDENYEIFSGRLGNSKLKNLTRAKGYDAEASFSPDGKYIAFASNRNAYTGSLSAEEQKKLSSDPSYFMDIFIMKSDGSGVRQLTTTPGYDGGPFFSPDGKSLTFRRFSPDGHSAEIYTIGVDGQGEKQITQLKAMSWAPFYHPSGDYLIFGSNKLGYNNFELFIVDKEGQHEPVRVTDWPGFDSLPVFTPDGHSLLWTHAAEGGEGQLYKGKFDEALARKALGLKIKSPAGQDLKNWLQYLASGDFKGRASGSDEEKIYTDALAKELREHKFSGFKNKDLIHEYEFTSGIALGNNNQLRINGIEYAVKQNWIPLSFSKVGKSEEAALVFAGYGIVAPATAGQTLYDSYQNLDVKGKWVAVFSGIPEGVSQERRLHLHLYSRLQHKAMMARIRGAAGLVILDDSSAPGSDLSLKFEGRNEDSGLPVLRISNQLADQLFSSMKTTRSAWSDKLNSGSTEQFQFNSKLAAEIDLQLIRKKARNVVAFKKAPGAKETLVIGAHLDHLGFGEHGNSLAKTKDIHYGADDNASGVAVALQVAKLLSADWNQLKPKYNLLIGFWTGEELGLLGSTQFLKDHTNLKIKAYLNLDMVGRYREALSLQGVNSAGQWKSLIENWSVASKTPLKIKTQGDPYLPTDAMAFYLAKIPSISFFTGAHAEYHTPLDTPDLINYDGLNDISQFLYFISRDLLTQSAALISYQKVDAEPTKMGRGMRLYLGTIPDYSQELKRGVQISGTSKDSPAEAAGLKPGDVILALGGIEILNIQDYVYCLQALKANEQTPMKILRNSQELELTIVPKLR